MDRSIAVSRVGTIIQTNEAVFLKFNGACTLTTTKKINAVPAKYKGKFTSRNVLPMPPGVRNTISSVPIWYPDIVMTNCQMPTINPARMKICITKCKWRSGRNKTRVER